VGTNLRAARTAPLAGEVIPLQRGAARLIHARVVTCVERYVQAHPQSNRQEQSLARAQEQEGNGSRGRVEHTGRGVLGRERPIEEPHRREGIRGTLAQAEPRVVVGVDEDATCPQAHYASAEPRS